MIKRDHKERWSDRLPGGASEIQTMCGLLSHCKDPGFYPRWNGNTYSYLGLLCLCTVLSHSVLSNSSPPQRKPYCVYIPFPIRRRWRLCLSFAAVSPQLRTVSSPKKVLSDSVECEWMHELDRCNIQYYHRIPISKRDSLQWSWRKQWHWIQIWETWDLYSDWQYDLGQVTSLPWTSVSSAVK